MFIVIDARILVLLVFIALLVWLFFVNTVVAGIILMVAIVTAILIYLCNN